MRKLLMPIQGDYVAPRFDLATEVYVARFEDGKVIGEPKTIIMEKPSDEELCHMIIEEHISDVICGGIEEIHYNFLVWKKIVVKDGVIARWEDAFQLLLDGKLGQGDIVLDESDALGIL